MLEYNISKAPSAYKRWLVLSTEVCPVYLPWLLTVNPCLNSCFALGQKVRLICYIFPKERSDVIISWLRKRLAHKKC